MRLEEGDYQFEVVFSMDKEVIIVIVDKEKQSIIDIATITPRIVNELNQTTTIDCICLFDKAHDIFHKTNIPLKVLQMLSEKMKEHLGTNCTDE